MEGLPKRAITVSEAATRLGVTVWNIYRLIDTGGLSAVRLGRQFYLDADEVERRSDVGAAGGRSFSAKRAWALLFLEDGLDAPWIDAPARSRLRAFVSNNDLSTLRPRLVTRGRQSRFRAHPSDLTQLAHEPGLMRTGVSAAREVGLDLVAGQELDAYLTTRRLEELVATYRLRKTDDPNVSLRATPAITSDWPVRRFAPASAVTLDLRDDLEPRAREAGERLLARYIRGSGLARHKLLLRSRKAVRKTTDGV